MQLTRFRTVALAAAFAAAGPVLAHTDHEKPASNANAPVAAPPAAKAGADAARDARAYFTDLELQTQDGRKVRFYSDVLKGRTVLINVIYTHCEDACPMITQQLNQVRAQVGDRFGKDIFFITLTSDPLRDTPQAMKQFAKKQKADVPGWIYLTGAKGNVEQILKKLGQFSEEIEAHSTLLIGGNVDAKRWSKIRADAPPAAIAERLKLIAEPRPGAGDKPD